MFPGGSRYSVAGGGGGVSGRRSSIGIGIPEVVVKSNADVRALTYCDLKVTIFSIQKKGGGYFYIHSS